MIENLPNEEWKPIEGFPNYEVSNKGRVKSLFNNKETLLKGGDNGRGYKTIILCNGKHKSVLIHRLVANAFLPNPYNLSDVNHKDENTSNNCVENLEWLSHLDNLNYGTRKEKHRKRLSKPVFQYDFEGNLVKEWSSTKECSRNGFDQRHIVSCCNNKYKGFIWSYTPLN